jgi:tRNA/tmRNA/rRNA uracil-C5-methylase (TrmA/RlmC/RlmD family)
MRWHGVRRGRTSCSVAAAAAAEQQAARVRLVAGQELELECSDLAYGGEGVCRLPDGLVVFVDRALPGERLRARVLQAKQRFAKASKLETLRPHATPAEPLCQVRREFTLACDLRDLLAAGAWIKQGKGGMRS